VIKLQLNYNFFFVRRNFIDVHVCYRKYNLLLNFIKVNVFISCSSSFSYMGLSWLRSYDSLSPLKLCVGISLMHVHLIKLLVIKFVSNLPPLVFMLLNLNLVFCVVYCRSLFVFCPFSFGHCTCCLPFSIYDFWLPSWYLQTFLKQR